MKQFYRAVPRFRHDREVRRPRPLGHPGNATLLAHIFLCYLLDVFEGGTRCGCVSRFVSRGCIHGIIDQEQRRRRRTASRQNASMISAAVLASLVPRARPDMIRYGGLRFGPHAYLTDGVTVSPSLVAVGRGGSRGYAGYSAGGMKIPPSCPSQVVL